MPRAHELYLDQLPSYSEIVRLFPGCLLLGLLAIAGCDQAKRYTLVGQVLSVDAANQYLVIKHEDIRGFMPGMTMPFKVKEAAELSARKPGDLITATLVVKDQQAYLEDVRATGSAPIPAADLPHSSAPLLAEGTAVPDAAFLDQDGRARHLADWRGKSLAVTFIYTRCPLPDFCPLMDRHFAAVQQSIAADAALASRIHLLSVSFDPQYDTPAVLKTHAERAQADPAIWSFLTGKRETIDAFAGGFGVNIIREDGKISEIVHNLRTAVIDPNGRLVKILRGNEWQPAELLNELRAADGGR
jgi:protein SCO1/2